MSLADPIVIALQILSLILGLPGFLFAFATLVLKRAASRGSLWGFIETILRFLVVMLPWGFVGTWAALILFAVAGCSARWHHAASGVILAATAGSAVVMYGVARLRDAGQVWFYVPGSISACIAGWLFFAAKP